MTHGTDREPAGIRGVPAVVVWLGQGVRLEDVWFRYARQAPWALQRRRPASSARARPRSCSAPTAPASRPCSSCAAGVLRPVPGRRHATARRSWAGCPSGSRPTSRSRPAPICTPHGRPSADRRSRGDRRVGRAPRTSTGYLDVRLSRALQGHRAEGRSGPGVAGPARPARRSTSRGRAWTPRPAQQVPGHRRRRRRRGGRGPDQRPPRRGRPGCRGAGAGTSTTGQRDRRGRPPARRRRIIASSRWRRAHAAPGGRAACACRRVRRRSASGAGQR